MRIVRGVLLAVLLAPCVGLLAGCDSLDTFQIWDTKKKLPGTREEVFPGGVPGVQQGIPPELVKGYQEPQQPVVDPAAAAAAASAEKIEPKVEEKPKPKPRKVAKLPPKPKPPRPAPQQPAQAQAPWPAAQPQPQPAAQPAAAPWPAQQPQPPQAQPAPWPTAQH